MPATSTSRTETVRSGAEEPPLREPTPHQDDAKQRRQREASRRGGLKGGPARAARLSAKRRSEIASKAARARWA